MAKKSENKKKEKLLDGFDMTSEYAPPEPEVKPKFVEIVEAHAAPQMKTGVGLSISPGMAALTGEMEMEYPSGKFYPPSAITGTSASSGFGKSATTDCNNLIAEPLYTMDKEAEKVYAEYVKQCNLLPDNKKKPEPPPEDKTALRILQANSTRPCVVAAANLATQYGFRCYLNTKEVTNIKIAGEGVSGRTEFLLAAGEDGPFGAGRVSKDGVRGSADLKVNINFSMVTENAKYAFTLQNWRDGIVSRVLWLCLEVQPGMVLPKGIPREKDWKDDKLRAKIKPFQEKLMTTKGRVKCKQLNETADQLAIEIDDMVLLTNNNVLRELTNRLIRHAWTFSMLLWVSEGCKYHKYLSDWMVFVFKFGLWSVTRIFGEYFMPKTKRRNMDEVRKYLPKNVLMGVPNPFTTEEMMTYRTEHNINGSWIDHRRKLKQRELIRFDEKDENLFWKTELYYEMYPEDPTNPINNQTESTI